MGVGQLRDATRLPGVMGDGLVFWMLLERDAMVAIGRKDAVAL